MTTPMELAGRVFSGHPLAHELVHALGWTLLHFCWQGAIVAGLLWCVLVLLDGRSSQARYGAACFALALLVAMPVITFARIASTELAMRAEIVGVSIPIDAGLLLQVGVDEPAAPWPLRVAVALDRWVPFLLAVWFAGVIFFVVRLNFGLLVARRLRFAGTDTPPAELLELFDALQARLGIRRAVSLLHSARVQVPTVVGWLRPVVLLPASCLTGLSMEQIEAIFCHELAHVRRHDYLVSVFQSVVEALLFYHPAVWWVSKQVRRERECCCDEVAVGNGGDVLAYAKALSYLEERRAAFPEFVLGANGGVLTMRIKRLLGCKENAVASQFAAFTVLAVVLALAGSYVATAARAQPKAMQAAVASVVAPVHAMSFAQQRVAQGSNDAPPLQGVYKTWVNEDVTYIITPEERAAFLKLTNDEERDAFIESFWARRNPTPGTNVNSFKEEHYARIAYANQHFAEGDRPGWQTSRGRTYIVLGKPYSLDAHPSGDPATSTSPYEVWQYRAVGGAGQQVDMKFVQDSSGRYRLTAPVASPAAAMPAPPPPPAPGQPLQIAPGFMSGRLLTKVDPVYPPIAMAAHVQGPVVLHALISKTGTVEDLSVISGPEMLKSSALDAVHQWTYKPLLVNGEPQQVDTVIVVNYTAPENGPATAAAAGPDPLRVAGWVTAGFLISKINPVYPAEAKAAGVQGAVALRAVISKTGTIDQLQIVSGPPELTHSALDAVRQWRYTPYLLNGEPTEIQTTITVNFSLDGSADRQDVTPASISSGSISGHLFVPVKSVSPPESDLEPLVPQKVGSSAPAAAQPVGPNIRSIDYKGLNSVTLQEVVERFNRDGVGLNLETRYDPARIAHAAAELKQLLAEHGRPNATIKLATRTIPPGSIGIMFDVKEGPKAKLGKPSVTPVAEAVPQTKKDGVNEASGVQVRKIGGSVSAPIVIHQVEPEYSPEARKANFSGIELVNLIVDAQGLPQNVHILRGVGMGLDAKAVEAVKQYRFKPAMEGGKAVPVEVNIEVNFLVVPDKAAAGVALKARVVAAAPVLMARLDPVQFKFGRMVLAQPVEIPQAAPSAPASPAAQPAPATRPAVAQPKVPDAKERIDPLPGLTEEQRAEIEAEIAAAKRTASEEAKHLNSPEFRKEMEDAQRQALDATKHLNSPEFRKQMEDAQRQALDAVKQLNSPEFKKQLADAKQQALDAKGMDSDSIEFRKELEEVRKQIEAAADEIREARELANPPEKK
jgi:TonB family protein